MNNALIIIMPQKILTKGPIAFAMDDITTWRPVMKNIRAPIVEDFSEVTTIITFILFSTFTSSSCSSSQEVMLQRVEIFKYLSNIFCSQDVVLQHVEIFMRIDPWNLHNVAICQGFAPQDCDHSDDTSSTFPTWHNSACAPIVALCP